MNLHLYSMDFVVVMLLDSNCTMVPRINVICDNFEVIPKKLK